MCRDSRLKPRENRMLRHAVLCLPTWNTNLCCLKQKEKSQPIQTNDLALASGVGGGLHEAFSCRSCTHSVNPRVWGPPGLQPRGLVEAKAGCEKVAGEEGRGCTYAVPFSDNLHAGPLPGNITLPPLH